MVGGGGPPPPPTSTPVGEGGTKLDNGNIVRERLRNRAHNGWGPGGGAPGSSGVLYILVQFDGLFLYTCIHLGRHGRGLDEHSLFPFVLLLLPSFFFFFSMPKSGGGTCPPGPPASAAPGFISAWWFIWRLLYYNALLFPTHLMCTRHSILERLTTYLWFQPGSVKLILFCKYMYSCINLKLRSQ